MKSATGIAVNTAANAATAETGIITGIHTPAPVKAAVPIYGIRSMLQKPAVKA